MKLDIVLHGNSCRWGSIMYKVVEGAMEFINIWDLYSSWLERKWPQAWS